MARHRFSTLNTTYGLVILHWPYDVAVEVRDQAADIAFGCFNRDQLRRRLRRLDANYPRIITRQTFEAMANPTRRAA